MVLLFAFLGGVNTNNHTKSKEKNLHSIFSPYIQEILETCIFFHSVDSPDYVDHSFAALTGCVVRLLAN